MRGRRFLRDMNSIFAEKMERSGTLRSAPPLSEIRKGG